MKNNKLNTKKEKYLFMSMTAILLFLAAALLSIIILPVSSNSDGFQANVTVGNAAPVVSNVTFTDINGGSIQLAVSSNTNEVICYGAITDANGYLDVTSATAVFYHTINSSAASPDDKNTHYTDSSCDLFGGDGIIVYANCSVYFEHEALNGTWACRVTATDAASETHSSEGFNEVDQLIALSVINDTINFGSMTNGQNTTALQAKGVNISNEGNVRIDVDIKANTSEMYCNTSAGCLGVIGVGNISFNLTKQSYDELRLAYSLTNVNQTVADFDLDPEGIFGMDDLNATKYIYFGIQIPQGVKGEFNTNITISALIG